MSSDLSIETRLKNAASATPPAELAACFALLDDQRATGDAPTSRLYTGCAAALSCEHADDLPAWLADLQAALAPGQHAVLLCDYELGETWQGIAPRLSDARVAQALLFDRCDTLTAAQVDDWLAAQHGHAGPAGITDLQHTVDDAAFHEAIAAIHRYIAAGDVYQINYTLRLNFAAYGTPLALYRRLRVRQPVPYGAFIALPDGRTVLSLSPELFVQHTQGELMARPMKGTSAASGDVSADDDASASLANDPKNRAENVMITDLLRNDLGRIAVTGSVQVPQLFEVQRHGQVLQMTSTVTAQLRPDASMLDVFTALFPCGSITGAPKRRAMQIIRELEPNTRGLYTGAIGWIDRPKDGRSVGNFCLSVPIRTLVLQPPDARGLRTGVMGVGAGIVHDSVADDELAECHLKARFLTGLPHEFELFETLHASASDGARHLKLHLQRLRQSAAYFSFPLDEAAARQGIDEACAAMPPEQPHRLRLALSTDGQITVKTAPLSTLDAPVKVMLSPQSTQANNLFLRYKTTVREAYDHAWRTAEKDGAFDMLFFNERGELTEGGRSNVFVKCGGRWWTPPLSAGVLPGVMRSMLLADPALAAAERTLHRDDVVTAQALMVCNSLRGAMRAVLVPGPNPASGRLAAQVNSRASNS